MKNWAIFLALAIFLSGVGGASGAPYTPGFKTHGHWAGDEKTPVYFNFWYPAKKAPRDLSFAPWVISGAPNARRADGKFPLLVLSHATSGNRFAHHGLAARLASEGFVVVAPTHPRDNFDNMDDLYTWRQLLDRAKNIDQAIRAAREAPELSDVLAPGKIGFVGFGEGGTTGLLLGGAAPNCAGWHGYCQRAGKRNAYCLRWARERVEKMCNSLPLDEDPANPEISAMAIVAPAYGMMFDKYSFEKFRPEVLLVSAERDKINPAALHCEHIARILGAKARYLELPEADLGALLSRCPPALESEMPDVCLSVEPEVREKLQRELASALAAFFKHYLGGGG